MMEFLRALTRRRDERGSSAVEYGLLIAGIAAVMAATIFLFGGAVIDLFDSTCDAVSSSAAGGECDT